MSQGHNKKFYAGVAFVAAGMGIYLADRFLGHTLTTLDVIWHAIPFTIGGCLMMPKIAPVLFDKAMATVKIVFGRFTVLSGNGSPQDRDQ